MITVIHEGLGHKTHIEGSTWGSKVRIWCGVCGDELWNEGNIKDGELRYLISKPVES